MIALTQELEPDLPFVEAVYRLLGGSGPDSPGTPQQRHTPRSQQYPKMALGGADAVAAGRSYLRDMRMIDDDSMDYAEQSQMLRYDPQGRLLFAGYDEDGRARNVTRRAINSRETVQKRDLRGSDKSFPPILPGDKGASVWIVEGGVDAIARHAEARTAGKKIPNIIVSGGSGVRSFLENRAVQQLLRDAPRVTIAADNEKTAEIQQRTDAQHEAQRGAVAAFNSQVTVWHPSPEFTDLGAMRVARELDRQDAADLADAEARVAAMQQRPSVKNREAVESEETPREPEEYTPKGPSGPGS